jgi:tRNA threonylcarbamoyladenosine biosynthesis protein TsaB
MLILALDTTSEAGGVGIFRDEECLAHVPNDGPASRYSVSLFTMVDRAIEEARARHGVPERGLSEVELIAVANGPGSFTGIRVGLAAAQGWAKAFGLPVCGVPVLAALVEAAQARTDWVAPILDARRGEFFLGLFHRQAQGSTEHMPGGEGWLLKPAELESLLAGRLPEGTATCVVREHDQAALRLREGFPELCQWQVVPGTLVEAIAHLGLRAFQTGKLQAASDLDALYIRRPDAELNWKA